MGPAHREAGLPPELGRITGRFHGNGEMVFYIEDLHCELEVQQNIARIIRHLVERRGVRLVGEEGGEAGLDLSFFRRAFGREIRETMAGAFLEKGMISGAEFYGLSSDKEIMISGVEDPGLYSESREKMACFLTSEARIDLLTLHENLSLEGGGTRSEMFQQGVRRLGQVEKILNISATPAEVREFESGPENVSEPLGKLAALCDPETGRLIGRVTARLKSALAFYKLANRRSGCFVKKLLREMERGKLSGAVLVAGGFHSREIQRELRSQGIGYMAIRPSRRQPARANPYFEILKSGHEGWAVPCRGWKDFFAPPTCIRYRAAEACLLSPNQVVFERLFFSGCRLLNAARRPAGREGAEMPGMLAVQSGLETRSGEGIVAWLGRNSKWENLKNWPKIEVISTGRGDIVFQTRKQLGEQPVLRREIRTVDEIVLPDSRPAGRLRRAWTRPFSRSGFRGKPPWFYADTRAFPIFSPPGGRPPVRKRRWLRCGQARIGRKYPEPWSARKRWTKTK